METLLPTSEHTHTVILLHGRNTTASTFKPDFFESESSSGQTLPELFPGIKWLFPSAPPLPSRAHRTPIPQWFDMRNPTSPHHREEEQDLISSHTRLSALITREARLIGHQNLFLGGLHQGAALAIHSLLAQPHRLAGYIALGSWFPKRSQTLAYFLGQNQRCDQIETPALVFHNSDDDEIDLAYGKELRNTLSDIGMRVKFHSYETGGNWLNEPEGVDALVRWLSKRMGRRSIDAGRRSQSQEEDSFSAEMQREVAVLARRIKENLPEERKMELAVASRNHRRDDPFARRLSCDPVEMYCLSRAQRQLGSSGSGGRMKLMSAS